MPTDAQFDVRNAPLDAAQAAALRAEVERLRHENRALVTALAELALIAERDCLTELFNRRYLLAALERRIRAVSRGAARAALIYLDVDGLKGINDRHGHAAGDHVLSEIARRLRAAVCDGDVVARIGGDEFAVLLDNLGPAETKQRLDRLIASVKGTPCRFKDQEIAVSAAFGVGMIRPGDDAEDLLCRADARMYRDKRGG